MSDTNKPQKKPRDKTIIAGGVIAAAGAVGSQAKNMADSAAFANIAKRERNTRLVLAHQRIAYLHGEDAANDFVGRYHRRLDALYEKTKKNNAVKFKHAKTIGLATLGLGATMIAGKAAYNHFKGKKPQE